MVEQYPGSDDWRDAVRWGSERSDAVLLQLGGDGIHYSAGAEHIDGTRVLEPEAFGHVDLVLQTLTGEGSRIEDEGWSLKGTIGYIDRRRRRAPFLRSLPRWCSGQLRRLISNRRRG
jgi:hypothetical protein